MPVHRVMIVFLKFPEPGRVKTRLASGFETETADEKAVEVYQQLVARVLGVLAESDFDKLRITYDPPDAEPKIRAWLQPDTEKFPESTAISFHPQSQGDLGDRLQTAIHTALADSENTYVAAIGTDCVEITPDHISQIWTALAANDLVFGPTHDGGYYLVAANQPTPEIFTDIPWSTEETLAASLKNAHFAGLTVAQLEKLHDVDTVEDWERAKKHLMSQ